MSFTTIHLEQTGGDNLERINKIMAGIPGGAFKVTYSALKRAADTAKTKAGQFAAAEYTIGKGDFMRNVTEKVNVSGGAGGVASIKISYGGHVLSLLDFDTRVSRNGTVTTKVMRNGGPPRSNTRSRQRCLVLRAYLSALETKDFRSSKNLAPLPDT